MITRNLPFATTGRFETSNSVTLGRARLDLTRLGTSWLQVQAPGSGTYIIRSGTPRETPINSNYLNKGELSSELTAKSANTDRGTPQVHVPEELPHYREAKASDRPARAGGSCEVPRYIEA